MNVTQCFPAELLKLGAEFIREHFNKHVLSKHLAYPIAVAQLQEKNMPVCVMWLSNMFNAQIRLSAYHWGNMRCCFPYVAIGWKIRFHSAIVQFHILFKH